MGRLTCVIQAATAARAALPIPTSVCGIFVCLSSAWLPVFWIFNVLADVHGATAYGSCANTVRESALKADFGGIERRSLGAVRSRRRISIACGKFPKLLLLLSHD